MQLNLSEQLDRILSSNEFSSHSQQLLFLLLVTVAEAAKQKCHIIITKAEPVE